MQFSTFFKKNKKSVFIYFLKISINFTDGAVAVEGDLDSTTAVAAAANYKIWF